MIEHNQQFDSFDEWENRAELWLGVDIPWATCIDARDRIVKSRGDFTRARDENAFPVRWYWSGQTIKLVRERCWQPIGTAPMVDHGVLLLLDCDGAKAMIVASYDGSRWQTLDGTSYHRDLPTHWMPLPKLPDGDEK